MPSHMEEPKKWETFIQTISNNQAIKVNDVNDEEVTFTVANIEELKDFKELLADTKVLKANIIHALDPEAEITGTTNLKNISQLTHILNYSAKHVITRLISADFLEYVGVNPEEFKDHSDLKIASFSIPLPTPARSKRILADLNLLRSSLSDPNLLSQVLLDKKPLITDELEGEPSEFSNRILKHRIINEAIVEVEFNYGYLLQLIQNEITSENLTAPVISSKEELQFTLNKNYFLRYLNQVIESGVVFKEEGEDLRPIMFQAKSQNEKEPESPVVFHILLDRSGSMSTDLPEYKEEILKIIEQIKDRVDNPEVRLTTFHHEASTSQAFHLKKTYDYNSLKALINGLIADGGTDLYTPIFKALEKIETSSIGNHRQVLILFTDGRHEERVTISEESVKSKSAALSKSNSQFTMYTMGYGIQYKQEFFNTMAQEGGFTHINLKTLDKMQEFGQYLRTIGNSQVVYEFITEAKRIMEKCAEGDIAIAQSTIGRNAEIKHGTQSYVISSLQSKEEEKPSTKLNSVELKQLNDFKKISLGE
jgi:Mg-chelatase subunit ChlD